MSSKTYPRLGNLRTKYPECSCCAAQAVRRVDIEINYMRGDDETLNLCDFHLSVAKTNAALILQMAAQKKNPA